MKNINFRSYNQGQTSLFPERLDKYIPENAPVRTVWVFRLDRATDFVQKVPL